MKVIEFDPVKDAINVLKHGLSLADALLVYDAPVKVTVPVMRDGENRWMDIAHVESVGVVLMLVYVVRGDALRPISLRRASKVERRLYREHTES
ncbi:MAG: BrnT family toxin [Castellaniella sp.]|uniref:BrnT family toxin n=1 Tax=Castellaniella sp. TaxID=1955812 RepID=UPI002A36E050|nr:BrnT family toxin [Castellaniella sp.]MDY0310124.1 BrnT family toxin [Castellaniella sp.]